MIFKQNQKVINLLNNYIFHYIIILHFLKADFTSISIITLLISPILFFRDCFSSNNRSLIIIYKKKKVIDIFFFKRFLYILILLLLYWIFKEFIFDTRFQNLDYIIYLIIIIILILWLNEIVISFNEINKNLKAQKIQFFLLTSLYILIFIFLILKVNLFILISINISLFIICFNNFNLKNYLKNKLIFDYKNFIDFNLLSTFCLSFTNLIWRVLIFLYLDSDWAGILFVIFAFATFPS